QANRLPRAKSTCKSSRPSSTANALPVTVQGDERPRANWKRSTSRIPPQWTRSLPHALLPTRKIRLTHSFQRGASIPSCLQQIRLSASEVLRPTSSDTDRITFGRHPPHFIGADFSYHRPVETAILLVHPNEPPHVTD